VKRTPALATVAITLLAALFLCVAGCSKAPQYAREARSSYVSARAVLVGVQEFPSQMETLLRSQNLENARARGQELVAGARELITPSYSAFRTCREKCERLKAEDSARYNPYADMMLELTDLNDQLIGAYSQYIGSSGSLLQAESYKENPSTLMPALNGLDALASFIQELRDRIALLEEEAERLYRSISE
jgi:hypothetical protein